MRGKTADQGGRRIGALVEAIELLSGNVADIESHIQQRLHLAARAAGHVQKCAKSRSVLRAKPSATFDIADTAARHIWSLNMKSRAKALAAHT